MHITSLGKAALLLIFLTLWNAVNGGLNTLYMAYSAIAAMLLISWAGVRFSSIAVHADVILPDQIFSGDPVPIRIIIKNRFWLPLHGMTLTWREGSIPIGDIPPRGKTEIVFAYQFPHRGLNAVTDVRFEFRFPFGLFVHTKALHLGHVNAFPQLIPIIGKPHSIGTTIEEVARPRRGTGDEFWGIREFVPGDDARLISWRLSAKAGKPVIREYAEMTGDRVIICVTGHPYGKETEHRILEAASLARFFVDEGAEVRLITDEGEIDYGRGLMQLDSILQHLSMLGEGKTARSTGLTQNKSQKLTSTTNTSLIKWATYVMATVIAAGLWIIKGPEPFTAIIVSVAIPLGFAMDRKDFHPVPVKILNALNIAVIALVIFVDIPIEGLLPGITHLLSWALINRLLSPKGPNNYRTMALTLVLLFLLISWQTIDPIFFAVFIALIATVCFWTTVASENAPKFNTSHIWSQTSATLATLALASIVFTVTPRLSNPRFAKMMQQLGLKSTSLTEPSIVKLADRLTLGVFKDVRVNGKRVMQVKISGIPIPEGSALYVRGGALDSFDGKEWSRSKFDFDYSYFGKQISSTHGRALYEQNNGAFISSTYNPSKPAITQEFFIHPMATSVIFSMGDPTFIKGNILQPTYDLTGTAFASSTFEEGTHYIIHSQSPEIRFDTNIEGYGEMLKKIFLALPKESDDMIAIRQIAADITGDKKSFAEKVEALERYFHDNYAYSYMAKHSRQSLRQFLTETKAANCEYFASGMALMLRTQGIPSRLIVGYLSTDLKRIGEYFDVRNSDGHAWVEAYTPEQGWISFDPTPTNIATPEFSFLFGRKIYAYLLGFQMSWYRYVIGYDFYVQQDALIEVVAAWRNIVAILATVVAALAIAVALFFFIKGILGFKRTEVYTSHVAKNWLAVERLLARYGFRRFSFETPLEFARRIETKENGLSATSDLAKNYYRLRFEGKVDTAFDINLEQLKKALRQYSEIKLS